MKFHFSNLNSSISTCHKIVCSLIISWFFIFILNLYMFFICILYFYTLVISSSSLEIRKHYFNLIGRLLGSRSLYNLFSDITNAATNSWFRTSLWNRMRKTFSQRFNIQFSLWFQLSDSKSIFEFVKWWIFPSK